MQKPQIDNGEPEPIEELDTPGQTTIEDVANYLGVEKSKRSKRYSIRPTKVLFLQRSAAILK